MQEQKKEPEQEKTIRVEIVKSKLQQLKEGLLGANTLAMFKDSLPKALGKAADEIALRFAKNIYTYLCQNPDLQECSLPSIIRASSLSASLNLDIDPRGLAYLVPYWNNSIKPSTREAQFQIGYLGLVELAYRSGKVLDIAAHCIYASEKDSVKISRINGRYTVEHPFSYLKPTGEIIATYATAEIEGFGPRTIVMRTDEVERLRAVSKAPDSPAWKNHKEAMYKKTAVRQLAKFLPKSIIEDFSKGAAIDEQETFVEMKPARHIIDTAFEKQQLPDGSSAAEVTSTLDKEMETTLSEADKKRKEKLDADAKKILQDKNNPTANDKKLQSEHFIGEPPPLAEIKLVDNAPAETNGQKRIPLDWYCNVCDNEFNLLLRAKHQCPKCGNKGIVKQTQSKPTGEKSKLF